MKARSRQAMPRGNSPTGARTALAERLRERSGEIEEALLTRTFAIADPSEIADPEYMDGLRMAVTAALDYGITALERGGDREPPVPPVLLAQARLAASNRVSLDTVLRRYFAGYTLLGDFMVEETEGSGSPGTSLQGLLRLQASLFDRLLEAVTDEYNREAAQPGSREERRSERIQRLLAGEPLDTSDFGYDFEGAHVGMAGLGRLPVAEVRDLATELDSRLLFVRPGESVIWAWFGARRELTLDDFSIAARDRWGQGAFLAFGEPATGRAGWRLTHRQATAALPVALRSDETVVKYADTALLASMLRDDLLVASMQKIYLEPLSQGRDRGKTLRRTLRAYFAHERNISSTAAALRVSRQTVKRHLHAAEQRLGVPIGANSMNLEVALRLDQLGDPSAPMSQDAPSS